MSFDAWTIFALFWLVFVTTPGPNAVNCITNGMTLGFPRALIGVLAILTQASLFLVLSAVICDCNSWDEIEDFGQDQLEWLRGYYPYSNGIPRHDTLNRVISLIDSNVFSQHFSRWIWSWVDLPAGSLVCLDGKTSRRSKGSNGEKAVHLVNAFANDLQLVLGQVATESKSNEITAIPELLNLLSIKGCLITIDAMGTQKAIARQIKEQGGEYILNLKANHSQLHAEVIESFQRLEPIDTFEQTEKNKSRLETRKVELIQDWTWIDPEQIAQWEGLTQVARVHRKRENLIDGKIESEISYYLLSTDHNAQIVASAIRGHWGIENRLHWRLDVLFGEDQDRKRSENAAANITLEFRPQDDLSVFVSGGYNTTSSVFYNSQGEGLTQFGEIWTQARVQKGGLFGQVFFVSNDGFIFKEGIVMVFTCWIIRFF